MKKGLKFLIVLMMFFAFTTNTEAKTIEHFYSESSKRVVLNDDVNGSSALAGEEVDITSKVNGIVFGAGNLVDFSGNANHAFLAGNDVNVNGVIDNELFAAGSKVTVNGTVNRDAILAGETVTIKGTLNRNVSIYASEVYFESAKIKGSVKINAEKIVASNGTIISGDFSYPADSSLEINKNSVGGKIIQTENYNNDQSVLFDDLAVKAFSYMSLAIIFALLAFLAPKIFEKMQNQYENLDFGKGVETFTKGLVTLIVVPVLAVILLFTYVGIPLSLILLALYVIAIYLSTLFVAYLLGYKLWQKFANKEAKTLLIGVLGLIVLFVLELIPGITIIISILELMIGLGVIWDLIKHSKND